MNLLTMESISKSYTERMLLSNINLGIDSADRIGIIGINGTGKSTLLKIIAGLEEPDTGTVTKGKKVRIEFLPQNPVFDLNQSILQNVLHEKTAEEAYRNLEGEATSMLAKLGIFEYDKSPEFLSGGQKKRVSLVRTLLTTADILLLDEPTNHLDNAMTEWLEDYLNRYRGAIVMVTHDRYFLDRVTNRILEIDRENLYSYQANYSKFLQLKAEREEMEAATERKNKSLYRMELEWMMRGARARSTKQKAHIQRFEELRDRKQLEAEDSLEIASVSTRLGRKTIELNAISKGYGAISLIKEFSYILLPGDHIGIIGHNGCGKSTLLKLITGVLAPDSGEVYTGTTVKIGYFSQENEALNESLKVLDYVRETAEYIETPDGTLTASAMCERFLFTGSMQHSLISKLSGGEKRRLYLLKILMDAPNVLVLDEPTNDLDIKTLTILEDYLQNFDGIVITVSHDRYFLNKVVDRIFAFEENGRIVQYEGGYFDYKEKHTKKQVSLNGTMIEGNKRNVLSREQATQGKQLNSQSAASAEGNSKSNQSCVNANDKVTGNEKSKERNSWKKKEDRPRFTYQEQKEFDSIDETIEQLENQKSVLESDINNAASDYSKLNSLIKEKEALEKQLEETMNRWVYLNDLAEQIKAYKNSGC